MGALLIHEFGHYLASRMVGERINSLELTPFGGVMYVHKSKAQFKGIRGIIVALSGPLANYISILLLTSTPLSGCIGFKVIQKMILSNTMMMCMNLIPALPLDGGQAVFCAGYYFFRVSVLISILTCLGFVTAVFLIFFAVYGFAKYRILNISMIIVGLFLAQHANNRQKSLRAENLYVILQEQMEQDSVKGKPVRFFEVSSCLPLYAVIPFMTARTASVFIIQDKEQICFISASKVCSAMLRNPNLLFKQIIQPNSE